MTPFLHDDELASFCHPLRQSAAIRRYLDRMEVPYVIRPDGRPVVGRNTLSARFADQQVVMQQEISSDTPDLAALQDHFKKKVGKHGTSS